jgi:hypothetical protein
LVGCSERSGFRARASLRFPAGVVQQKQTKRITDLKQRGLLEETFIVWCGEFGRTADNGIRGSVAYGCDHNPNVMTIWLAGGGCR